MFMDLIIDQDGYFLGKCQNRFYVSGQDEKGKRFRDEFSADNVRSIMLSCRGSVSVGAMELANQHYIDMVVLGRSQKPIARIYPCSLSGAHLVRRLQLEAHKNSIGLGISTGFEAVKMQGQANLLKSLQKARMSREFDNSINEIELLASELEASANLSSDEVMGREGRAAAVYFREIGKIIPLERRDPDGNDKANILLNYGYAVLYHEVERACWIVGLDPYLGFLHADRPGKPSLALDLMEPFRPIIVDRAVVTLFTHNEIEEKDFEYSPDGKELSLSKNGRKKILSKVLERLNTEYTFDGMKRKWSSWILEACREVARGIRGEEWKIVKWSGG